VHSSPFVVAFASGRARGRTRMAPTRLASAAATLLWPTKNISTVTSYIKSLDACMEH
jgi:hypothetical protein